MVDRVTLKNTSIDTSLSIDSTSRTYVLESIDWGAIQSSRRTYKFINQIGVYVTGVTLESRDISIVGWVVADTETDMKRRKQFLNKFVNPLNLLKLYYENYVIDAVCDTTIQYGTTQAENNEVVCKFMINLFCPDPMFREAASTVQEIADWIPKFHFPLQIPKSKGVIFGVRQPSTIATLDNTGDRAVGFIATFVAEGTVVNPELLNVITQQRIRLNYTFNAGETIIVSTVTNKKTVTKVTNGESSNRFNLLDLSVSELFDLQPGKTYLRYDAEEGLENLNIKIEYDTKFLEVQI